MSAPSASVPYTSDATAAELPAALRVAGFDWSRTPLGPRESWPDLLHATVDVMLESRQPGFVAWGPERTMLYNDGYAPMLGNKHPWAMGRPFAEVWADILDDVGPVMDRAYAGQATHMDDIRFVMHDRHGFDEEVHFAFSYIPVRDRTGQVLGMVCTCRETTQTIQTEQLLAFQLELGDRLRLLSTPHEVQCLSAEMLARRLQAGAAGYASIDRDRCYVHAAVWSDGSLPMKPGRTGSLREAPQLLAELDAGRNVVLHDAALAHGGWQSELAGLARDIGVQAMIVVPLHTEDCLTGCLFVAASERRRWTTHEVELAHDVAERTWTAMERVAAEAALREARERLAATLESADIATWDYDAVQDLVMPDDNLAALFGVPAEEVRTGAPLESFVLGCHAEDQDRVRDSLRDALACGADWHSEHRIVQASGAHRWIMARGRIERDAERRPVRMLGVLVDITDRKYAEEALQEADRRKDEFLATLAHELRNPLAPIRSAARISSDPSATLSQLRWSHEVIERQVRNMALLLDDLLDVSRITRGILEVRREPTTAAAIVEAALETARPVIDARQHTLVVEADPMPVALQADPLRMAQALSNLLTNAAKYTDPGGRIVLSSRFEGGALVLRVRDSGIGMATSTLPRVFGMFSQVESALDRSEGGLGIGLALVKGIVELHGGTVAAHSEGLGLGSEFSLRVPGAAVGRTEVAAPAAAPEAAVRPVGPLRVALADDNQDGAETLAALLELDGYEVRIANDGLAALELVRLWKPDAVFLDIGMPGLNGYEVARELRKSESTAEGGSAGAPPLVLVALTGWGGAEDKKRAMAAGFDFHLTKPVDPDAITEILAGIRPADGG
ncbi:ATP-binding protein [uncultured Xylophilus sp.]|uniref:hybrid sensor histidine kinase/response regulator n=1 Tax=uncultured Xylophilus sp. TaxID=296832 RepID=UPI0025D98312|nr:ATP-binding protein [uncultured Xylophilus sp.]